MGKLIVVGAGVKSLSHITLETQKVINNADHCLFLVSDNYLKKWIEKESKSSESLSPIYVGKKKRIDVYVNIADYIVSQVSKYSVLCVIFYGHPTFFASSALWAAKKIKKYKGEVVVLPGISSFDTLCSDLLIDPGDAGCAFYEATDFLIYKRCFDVRSHLILFQAGVIGAAGQDGDSNNLSILVDYLIHHYSSVHEIIKYEAPTLPTIKPVATAIALKNLGKSRVGKLTTLYIPPLETASLDTDMVSKLGMNLADFMLT